MSYDVIVVGAGIAGVIAAGAASLKGAKTLLLESGESIGVSLRNSLRNEEYLTYNSRRMQFQNQICHGSDFMETALKIFSPKKLCTFLEGLAVPYELGEEEEILFGRGGRTSFVSALTFWLERLDVDMVTEAVVTNVIEKECVVVGVEYFHLNETIEVAAESVVIATGAQIEESLSKKLNKKLSHHITPVEPSLFPIPMENSCLDEVALPKSRIYLWDQGKKVMDFVGDILFSEGVLTGIPVLNISRYLARLSFEEENYREISLTIDTNPKIDDGDLKKELNSKLNATGKKPLIDILEEYVPHKIGEMIIIRDLKSDLTLTCESLTKAQRKIIMGGIKRFEPDFRSNFKFADALTVSGGTHLDEINADTMGSYIHSGLYFAGEVLDIDALYGGYNLQIAFSTGKVAGESAAGRL